MRDCANCFHRKPVLKEDGTWTAECEKWDCEFQSRENMIEKTEAKGGDLISREALKKDFKERLAKCDEWIEKAKDKETRIRASTVKAFIAEVIMTIDRAYDRGYITAMNAYARPKGDLISRQDAIDALEEQLDYLQMLNKNENPTAEGKWYGVNWARNTISDLPYKQNERPQGEWITVSHNCWKCPYCQELTNEGKNFCPNCGAEMQKGGAK